MQIEMYEFVHLDTHHEHLPLGNKWLRTSLMVTELPCVTTWMA